MNEFELTNARIVTPTAVIDRGCLGIEDGRIKYVSEGPSEHHPSAHEKIDCSDCTIVSGFVDVHTHGGIGFDFTDDEPGAFDRLSEYYYSHGVTTLLATLSPLPHVLLKPAVERLADFCLRNRGNTNIRGIHLEGPYINRSMAGGNQEDYVEEPDLGEWIRIRESGRGFIRLMTVAPELRGILPVIEDSLAHGISISAGHSKAGGSLMSEMIGKGVSQVTHLFNSMPQLHHREDGMLAEALLSDRVDVQLIADGVHVHPKVILLTVRLKSADHVAVITDSIRATQAGDGEYTSAGKKVIVRNGVVRSADGRLAGSTLTMEKALSLLVSSIGIGLPEASRMTSLTAARSLGLGGETGSLEPGKQADIAVLDGNLSVRLTIGKGAVRFRA